VIQHLAAFVILAVKGTNPAPGIGCDALPESMGTREGWSQRRNQLPQGHRWTRLAGCSFSAGEKGGVTTGQVGATTTTR
jgi:hypothetical protein